MNLLGTATLGLGLGCKTEVARLHTHRQQHQRKGYERIDIGHNAVGCLTEHTRIERREQVTQQSHDNGADAIDGCLFC